MKSGSVGLWLLFSIPLIGADNRDVSLAIHFANGRTQFHVGEVIPIELEFTASIPDVYEMSTANYDRSGRLNMEQFHVAPAGRDPLQNYYAGAAIIGGGLSSSRMLGAEPQTMREELNEWVTLDQPGHYALYVTSGRVSHRTATGYEPVTLRSNTLEFDVIVADAPWRALQLNWAGAVLNDSGSETEQKHVALRTLRFLDTPASLQELVRQLGKGSDTGCWNCVAGLAGSLHQQAAVDALTQEMDAPDVAITQEYIFILAKLKLNLEHGTVPPYLEDDQKAQEAWRQNLNVRDEQMAQLEDSLYDKVASLVDLKLGAARTETERTVLLRPAGSGSSTVKGQKP